MALNNNVTILNQTVLNLIQVSSQENIWLKSLEKFYENLHNINEFLSIINSNSIISIRLIDHFVTKYAKKFQINLKINDSNVLNVYQSYKQQLKKFQKKNFDPFARGIRIPYFIKDTCIITTIGQLNFFNWFIVKDLIYKDNIENYMNKEKKNKTNIKIKKPIKIYKKKDNKINTYINNNNINTKITNQILVTF
jgi:hypothetical protein